MKLKVCSLALLVAFQFQSMTRANEPSLGDVLQSCPKPANAILHGDVNAIRKLSMGTPLEFDMPAGVDRVKIAAELNFSTLQPSWEIGYAALKAAPSADAIAKRMGGYVDNVNNRPVIWTPNQMYLVPLQNEVLSIVRPADRKFLGQWLKKDRSPSVSDYLKRAAGAQLADVAAMIAVDLEDLISAEILEQNLAGLKSIAGKDVKKIARSIAGMHGVTLSVNKGSLSDTVITLEFKEAPTELTPIAKAFFNEVFERRGSAIGDFSKWNQTASSDGKILKFTGEITHEALDDLLGLFTIHRHTNGNNAAAGDTADATKPAPTQESSASVIAENSKEYFKKVVQVVHRVRDYSANNTGERAQWNANMANRIDEMPTLNIDTDLVQFASEVAKSLRTNSASMQLTNIASGAQAVANDAGSGGDTSAVFSGTNVQNLGYGYASFGYGGNGNYADPNSPMKYYQVAQAKGNASFKQMMAQMEQAISDMRRTMTNKYKIQF